MWNKLTLAFGQRNDGVSKELEKPPNGACEEPKVVAEQGGTPRWGWKKLLDGEKITAFVSSLPTLLDGENDRADAQAFPSSRFYLSNLGLVASGIVSGSRVEQSSRTAKSDVEKKLTHLVNTFKQSKEELCRFVLVLNDSEFEKVYAQVKESNVQALLSHFPDGNQKDANQLLECINLENAARQIMAQIKPLIKWCRSGEAKRANAEFKRIIQGKVSILKFVEPKNGLKLRSIEAIEVNTIELYISIVMAIEKLSSDDQRSFLSSISISNLLAIYEHLNLPESQEKWPIFESLEALRERFIDEFVERLEIFSQVQFHLKDGKYRIDTSDLFYILLTARDAWCIEKVCREEGWYRRHTYYFSTGLNLKKMRSVLGKLSEEAFWRLSKEELLALKDLLGIVPSKIRSRLEKYIDREYLVRKLKVRLERVAELAEKDKTEEAFEEFASFKNRAVTLSYSMNIEKRLRSGGNNDHLITHENLALLIKKVFSQLDLIDQKNILLIMSNEELIGLLQVDSKALFSTPLRIVNDSIINELMLRLSSMTAQHSEMEDVLKAINVDGWIKRERIT